MEISEAVQFLACDEIQLKAPQHWMDLGCGSGTFTYALAELLAAGSEVVAVDKAKPSLKSKHQNAMITSMQADFVKDSLQLEKVDGILMANALHYVKDKKALLNKLTHGTRLLSRFLIVEYDLTKPINPWVPYPLAFNSLGELFEYAGFRHVRKLHERASNYNQSMIYSAVILK